MQHTLPKRAPAPIVRRRIRLIGLVGVVVAGCVAGKPATPPITTQPDSPPAKPIASFGPVLACVDQLLLAHGRQGIRIVNQGIVDDSGQGRPEAGEIVTTTIAALSARSHAFTPIDPPTPESTGSNPAAPIHNLRGLLTPSTPKADAAAPTPPSATPARNQAMPLLALELAIDSSSSSGKSLPPVTTKNTLSASNNTTGVIEKAGILLNIPLDRDPATSVGLRPLIELSLIEGLGRLSRVPYWKCLDVPATAPEIRQQVREWYEHMPIRERTTRAQTMLQGSGYLASEYKQGILDEESRLAISRYQSDNGLIADGRVTLDLYDRLLNSDWSPARDKSGASETAPAANAAEPASVAPLTLKLTTTHGKKPVVHVGEKLQLIATLTDTAHLYCFYQDHTRAIMRIFPNRFRSDPRVAAGEKVTLPQEDFNLRMDQPDVSERVLCLASRRAVDATLSPRLYPEDLTPMATRSLEEIRAAFGKADDHLADDTVTVTAIP